MNKKIVSFLLCFPFLFYLAGCSSGKAFAPVSSVSKPEIPPTGYYRVHSGDTLYSIAWAYAMDYRQLAALNKLHSPYRIQPGQMLRLKKSKRRKDSARRVEQHKPVKTEPVRHLASPVRHWRWPAKGRLLVRFSRAYSGNPGIDIGGRYGEPIRATAKGMVVYSGTGVRGYGNLIIVKHNNSYLSAYAFNKANLVKQGQMVQAGQVIARMGRNNAGRTLLHFEIRRNGKPVNPLKHLS